MTLHMGAERVEIKMVEGFSKPTVWKATQGIRHNVAVDVALCLKQWTCAVG